MIRPALVALIAGCASASPPVAAPAPVPAPTCAYGGWADVASSTMLVRCSVVPREPPIREALAVAARAVPWLAAHGHEVDAVLMRGEPHPRDYHVQLVQKALEPGATEASTLLSEGEILSMLEDGREHHCRRVVIDPRADDGAKITCESFLSRLADDRRDRERARADEDRRLAQRQGAPGPARPDVLRAVLEGLRVYTETRAQRPERYETTCREGLREVNCTTERR